MPHDEAAPPSHPSAGRGERAARVSAPEGGAVSEQNQRANTVVIGAGPAGLTAAYELGKRDHKAVVLEADDVVGGISRTARVGDWRFDIGGHRFFTKVTPVRELWHEMLPDEDFLLRPRMSRIFYRGRFYDYPLRAFNALRNLGVLEAVRCVLSYLWVRIRPPKDLTTFEGYIASKFGWRLYGIFFKTYTEKVWGVPADQIQADWAAQRVKNLDLLRAIVNSLAPRRNQKEITSLIEEFEYPRHGPGMMWERCHELVEGQGGEVHFHHAVSRIEHANGVATGVSYADAAARIPAYGILTALATVALAANAIHRHGEDFMGFPGESSKAHTAGTKARTDAFHTLHLIKGEGRGRSLELKQVPQGGHRPVLQKRAIGAEVVITGAFMDGLVQRLRHLRAVEVVFTASAVLHKAHELELAAVELGEGLGMEQKRFPGQLAHGEARHPAGGPCKGSLHHVGTETDRLKDLSTVITGEQGDADLGEDLAETVLQGDPHIRLGVSRGEGRQLALFDSLLSFGMGQPVAGGLPGEPGADGTSAVADQTSEVMGAPALGGLHHQRTAQALARP
ncbi:MAG: FAD-binding protein, partial [Actinobacteria bacterium]|nr:FAD-binding protein [Actinomycetota bacterium]